MTSWLDRVGRLRRDLPDQANGQIRPATRRTSLTGECLEVIVMHVSTMGSSFRTLATLTGCLGAILGANDRRRPATPDNSEQ